MILTKRKYESTKYDRRHDVLHVFLDSIVDSCADEEYPNILVYRDEDTNEIIDKMIHKILFLRIFEDENGKMNKSIQDVEGSILSISQFTLYADCKKGNRPSFTNAGKPDLATTLYDQFNQKLQEQGMHVETGVFGADMKIELLNDGPVTIVLDSKELF